MIEWIRTLALASIGIYYIFDHLDSRRVKDEREELIRLKSLELTHKASLLTLVLLSLAYIFNDMINVQVVILAMIVVSLYGEIVAKFYYRYQL
jgi:ABC-type xylose transport system permease subunit